MQRAAAALCAAILLLAGSATAQEAVRARLLTIPDAQAMSDAFPVVALTRGVSGRVVLSCAIAINGESECTPAEEAPAGMGFGAAAAELARDWRFSPRTENGQAVASTSRVPISFQNEVAEPVVTSGEVRVIATRGLTLPTEAPADFQPPPPQSTDVTVSGCPLNQNRCTVPAQSSAPEGDAWSWYYPAQAHAANAGGRVLVGCVMRSNRRIDCGGDRETPEGMGFGAAAVALIRDGLTRNEARIQPGTLFRTVVSFHTRSPGEIVQIDGEWEYDRMRLPTGSRRARQQTSNGPLHFPEQALRDEVSGSAEVICTIQADRNIECVVADETPRDYGFGEAAINTIEIRRVTEAAFGQPGLAPGDRIRRRVNFNLEN